MECGFKRADQEEIKLPERSSLVDLTKQDKIPDTCDVCDQPSVWRCKEKDAVDCRRKVYNDSNILMAYLRDRTIYSVRLL